MVLVVWQRVRSYCTKEGASVKGLPRYVFLSGFRLSFVYRTDTMSIGIPITCTGLVRRSRCAPHLLGLF